MVAPGRPDVPYPQRPGAGHGSRRSSPRVSSHPCSGRVPTA